VRKIAQDPARKLQFRTLGAPELSRFELTIARKNRPPPRPTPEHYKSLGIAFFVSFFCIVAIR
jgi:hypothetical protein